MKYSIRTKLSLSIALVVLLTVVLISILANVLIGNQFKGYITIQQHQYTQEVVSRISLQYDGKSDSWNEESVHSIGMEALEAGYILKVYDRSSKIIWDAEDCDTALCTEIMTDITHRMESQYPNLSGEFTAEQYPAVQNGEIIGIVEINHFGPFFLSEEDSRFLSSLNKILAGIGILALAVAVLVGVLLAKRLAEPIQRTVGATKKISDGDFGVRMKEDSSTREIEALIQSINQLAATLEQQESLRKQLTADVAHELRTPLTTVLTHVEALIEGIWEPTTERLQSCYDEVARISKLVADLENLAKVEEGNVRLNKSSVDLLDLANKMFGNFEIEMGNKKIRHTVVGNCSAVLADKDRISQVMMNLISNAVKYTPEGGEIRILLTDEENKVTFSVEDNGPGILPEDIPFIFERFYRGDKSRNRMTGGSGIGLAIVKSIVNAHGGTVRVESNPKQGSRFTVVLPLE